MEKENQADYYQLLGIDRNASQLEIKKAYRELAHQYHPDKGSGSHEFEERFLDITKAYQVLSEEKTRILYDHYGPGLAPAPSPISDLYTSVNEFCNNLIGIWRRLSNRSEISDEKQ